MIGQHYVRTGVLTNEDGALLARLQNMRHTVSRYEKTILTSPNQS